MNGSKGGTRSRFVGPLAVIVALLGLIFLAACDPALSIHTLYTDQDVVFEPSLVGTWVSSDETDEDLEIEKADKDSYLIKLLSKDVADNVNLEAHLVKIGGCLFLDAVQQNVAKGDAFAIPGHIIARVWLGPDSLRIAYLDDDGVSENDPVGATRLPDFGMVLTGSTAELQQFVIAHAEDSAVFAHDSDEMHRQN